jgi:UPF0755 protein
VAKKKGKSSFLKKVLIAFVLLFAVGGLATTYLAYKFIYKPNVLLSGKKSEIIYIPTGSNFEDVKGVLYTGGLVQNRASFEWLAERKNYKRKIKPGKYILKSRMTNNELLDLLRSGRQVPVQVTFTLARNKKELAIKIQEQLEVKQEEMLDLLTDDAFMAKYGLTAENSLTLFIPNTYEFYWNTSAKKFIERMAEEYKKFWNEKRKILAKEIGLTQSEVAVLASIVQQETYIDKEKPIVAGVYMNRLAKKMPLQADPTLIWAAGDFTIKRVTSKYFNIDSPYNTYKNLGLPPGPICLPSTVSLDAVLNYKKHNFVYFCAKEDFSGLSNYACSYTDHLKNARKYQQALNKRKIVN